MLVGCRSNLCELLEVHPDCINIKAKTHEKVDAVGEERAIACHTVVLLLRE
jgi:2-C-methyl-D-erythritol 2,4-cyclodiphosphate synthase